LEVFIQSFGWRLRSGPPVRHILRAERRAVARNANSAAGGAYSDSRPNARCTRNYAEIAEFYIDTGADARMTAEMIK
jgi:hypothetical protein